MALGVEIVVMGWDLLLQAQSKRALALNSVWLREDGKGKNGGNFDGRINLEGNSNPSLQWGGNSLTRQVQSIMDHDSEKGVVIGEYGKKRPREEIEKSIVATISAGDQISVWDDQWISGVNTDGLSNMSNNEELNKNNFFLIEFVVLKLLFRLVPKSGCYNSRTVIKKCQTTAPDKSIIGALIRDIQSKKVRFQEIDFQFVHRLENECAQNLGHEVLKRGEGKLLVGVVLDYTRRVPEKRWPRLPD
ncbi:hypothetical protein Gotur_031914 [Gossypium turneri]